MYRWEVIEKHKINEWMPKVAVGSEGDGTDVRKEGGDVCFRRLVVKASHDLFIKRPL
jgi:hypothetical protein